MEETKLVYQNVPKRLKSLTRNKDRVIKIKKIVNCILENGAYSSDNEQRQLAKGEKKYSHKQKIIVSTSWKYREFLGNQMEFELIELFKYDENFLEELKFEDIDLFNELTELVNVSRRHITKRDANSP